MTVDEHHRVIRLITAPTPERPESSLRSSDSANVFSDGYGRGRPAEDLIAAEWLLDTSTGLHLLTAFGADVRAPDRKVPSLELR